MESALILDLLEVLEKHNVIPTHLLRKERIKVEYKQMREQGFSCKKAKEELSNRHNVSIKSVEVIIYGHDAK